MLWPVGWVVAPQHVGSCFPDQRSDLHRCIGRGPLTTGPPGNPSAAFCLFVFRLFFQQCFRFPGRSVRCRMSFEMSSAAGMPRHTWPSHHHSPSSLLLAAGRLFLGGSLGEGGGREELASAWRLLRSGLCQAPHTRSTLVSE